MEDFKMIAMFVVPVLAAVILLGSYAYFFGAKKSPAEIEAQQQEDVKNPFANATPFELKLKGAGKRSR